MVEVTTKVETQTMTPSQRANANMKRLAELHKRPGVRVVPRDDDMRRVLKHPRAGKFRSEGSLEWPDDTFTRRRLRDGDVKLAEGENSAPEKAEPERPTRYRRSTSE